MRVGAEPGHAGIFQDFAGRGRRRIAAQRTSHFERHVFVRETRHGLCGVRACGGGGSHDRAVAGRLDHRQFFVALDFLYQRAGGYYFADSDEFSGERPAAHEARQCEERIPHRLHRYRADQPGFGSMQIILGQGPAARLAVVQLHPGVFRTDAGRHSHGDYLGAAAKKSRWSICAC